ncbi:MAG TPA: hypothetical protein VFQ48_06685 [Pseudonocardiaceae bacterium]|nr:hypothetical protein [Pseudonocardiaceae bacterium]
MTGSSGSPLATPPLVQQLCDAFWVGVPLRARRLSAVLAVATVDGLHLAVRPVIGAVSVPAALVFGMIVGMLHPGFENVFTEALWLLLLVAFGGAISGTLGLYFTVGFALGDLILGDHAVWDFLYPSTVLDVPAKYGSLLLSYGVLALLAVGVPIATKSLAAEFSLPPAIGRPLRGMVAVVAVVGITALLAFVWVQSAPILVRPIFLWAGSPPTAAAISPLQENGGVLVAAAACGALVRAVMLLVLANLASVAEQHGPATVGTRLIALEQRFHTTVPVLPLLSRLPLVLRLAGRVLLLTALLSGMFAEYWQAALTFLVLLGAQLLVSPLMPIRLAPFSDFLLRVPRLIRLLVALVPVYLFGAVIFEFFLDRGTTSFVPFLVVTMISVVLMILLFPRPPAGKLGGVPWRGCVVRWPAAPSPRRS